MPLINKKFGDYYTAITQVKDDGVLVETMRHRQTLYILKIEPMGFSDRLNLIYERKKHVKNNPKVLTSKLEEISCYLLLR